MNNATMNNRLSDVNDSVIDELIYVLSDGHIGRYDDESNDTLRWLIDHPENDKAELAECLLEKVAHWKWSYATGFYDSMENDYQAFLDAAHEYTEHMA